MSVVIKDMQMPDHCWECWLMRNMICGASGKLIPSSGKRKHCPLVALPDKHGDLIDRDACINYCRDSDQRSWEALAYAEPVIKAEDG